jgi:hypothetical protein
MVSSIMASHCNILSHFHHLLHHHGFLLENWHPLQQALCLDCPWINQLLMMFLNSPPSLLFQRKMGTSLVGKKYWIIQAHLSTFILSKKLIYCDNTVKTLIMYNIYHSIRTPCLLNSKHTYMKVRLAVTRQKSVLQSTKINIFLHLWIKWLHLRAYCNHHHRSCLCNTLWQWQIQKMTKAPLLALPIQ